MGMPVAEAQARISSAEFAEWMAYAELEPFGQGREDVRAGVIASLIANVNRDADKRSTPFEPFDFFPNLGEGAAPVQEEKTPEELRGIMQMITDAMSRGDR